MRVLVVDDEPDVRALVSTALGYAPMPVEVIEAGDGEQALLLARAAKRAETSCEEQATTQGGEATWVGTG